MNHSSAKAGVGHTINEQLSTGVVPPDKQNDDDNVPALMTRANVIKPT